MSGTVEELIVRAKPEGIDGVNRKFGQMKTNLNEAKGEMQDTAGSFSDLAGKFKGVLGAITAGLAVGVGGVLTQVPVLKQAMGGLKTVFQALGFQIDKALRPFISDLSKEFFDLSGAIADGDYEQVRKELQDIGNVLGQIDVGAAVDEISQALGKLTEGINFEQVAKDITDFRNDLLNDIIDAISNFADNLTADDVEGASDSIITVLKDSLSTLITEVDWFQLLKSIIQLMGKITEGVAKSIKNEIVDPLLNKIEEKFNEAIGDAKQIGKDLIAKIIEGLKDKIPDLESEISDLPGGNVLLEGADVLADGADAAQEQTTNFVRGQTGSPTISLDGRRLDERTGRYSFDRAARR
jgi:phage-related protein